MAEAATGHNQDSGIAFAKLHSDWARRVAGGFQKSLASIAAERRSLQMHFTAELPIFGERLPDIGFIAGEDDGPRGQARGL